MIYLPDVTVVCIDCLNYSKAVRAIMKSKQDIVYADILFFTDTEFTIPEVKTIIINSIKSTREYCEFLINNVVDYVETDYALVIQWDGFVLNPYSWTDEFLEYDYIGAPWGYKDPWNVGNGGFSLRSKTFLEIAKNDINIEQIYPEDHHLCRTYRPYLESIGIKFAPIELASRFSIECGGYVSNQFGFHQPRTHDIVKL